MEGFNLECNKTKGGSADVTFVGNIPLLNISLLHGEIRVKHYILSMCYNLSSRRISYWEGGMKLKNPPFTFSELHNRFIVIGFNTLAYMIGSTNVLGCWARSKNIKEAQDEVCEGVDCCQVVLTRNMSDYDAGFNDRYNTTNISTTDGAEIC